jgi:hypothetical protein
MQYVPAEGQTVDEMRENARKTELWKRGDMRLVWVNEGDLTMSKMPICPKCGRVHECSRFPSEEI